MIDTPTIPRRAPAPAPPADVQALGRLVGTWRVWGGGAEGTVTYEWLEGGFFLLQTVDLRQDGEPIRGVEIIGPEQSDDTEPSGELQSRYYDNVGNTFDYVYEIEGDTLTIWAGEKGSPAYYRGVFCSDGTTLTGRWAYPGGGSDDMTAVRTPDPTLARAAGPVD